ATYQKTGASVRSKSTSGDWVSPYTSYRLRRRTPEACEHPLPTPSFLPPRGREGFACPPLSSSHQTLIAHPGPSWRVRHGQIQGATSSPMVTGFGARSMATTVTVAINLTTSMVTMVTMISPPSMPVTVAINLTTGMVTVATVAMVTMLATDDHGADES